MINVYLSERINVEMNICIYFLIYINLSQFSHIGCLVYLYYSI